MQEIVILVCLIGWMICSDSEENKEEIIEEVRKIIKEEKKSQ